jgi:putative ABC transport system ATP-binding protein
MMATAGGVAVVVEGVRKAYENGRIRALEEITLRVQPGEIVALTGPSGCGKSTLLNMIGALDRPDAGRIHVGDIEVTALRDPVEYRATTIGFVFQFHHLIPTLTALENVQLPLLGRGIARGERVRRARELVAEVGLADRARSSPATLSGGERQRIALARALALDPPLLLADEPTGALDSATGAQIVALLHRVRDTRGTTILLVTNDDRVALEADRIVRLRDGRAEEAAVTRSAERRSAEA